MRSTVVASVRILSQAQTQTGPLHGGAHADAPARCSHTHSRGGCRREHAAEHWNKQAMQTTAQLTAAVAVTLQTLRPRACVLELMMVAVASAAQHHRAGVWCHQSAGGDTSRMTAVLAQRTAQPVRAVLLLVAAPPVMLLALAHRRCRRSLASHPLLILQPSSAMADLTRFGQVMCHRTWLAPLGNVGHPAYSVQLHPIELPI